MKYFNRIQTQSLYFLALSLFVLSSCKKEYENIKKPYNEIQRFAMAGYTGLDSLHASIVDDQIVVNWSATIPVPEKAKPMIRISSGAAIAPASGTEIDFKDGTSYTVTAEDGTQRVYKIKINKLDPMPRLLTAVTPVQFGWLNSLTIGLTGEYFLSGGGASAIKVYLQRVKDGVEVDLPVPANSFTQTTLTANLPTFDLACDTGWHKVFLKVGNLASQSVDVYMSQPMIREAKITSSFEQEGQTVAIGQQLKFNYSITDDFGGAVARYYTGKIKSFWIGARKGNTSYVSFEATILKVTDNEVSFTIPQSAAIYSGYEIYHLAFRSPRPLVGLPDYTDLYRLDLPAAKTFIQ
ncbi:MAG: hypothetical protein EOO42_01430 [Flavobacteriales bacterium]|nr:MAG: hypothetical protein EOO42_01430 [Flavobacteriales bacterium]